MNNMDGAIYTAILYYDVLWWMNEKLPSLAQWLGVLVKKGIDKKYAK